MWTGRCVLFLALIGALLWGWQAAGRRAVAAGEAHDDAVYYRVKVGLSHKGEPIDFDVVVGCGARVSSDGYSGGSVDILGWYPFVYAKAIPGGHAVLLRTSVDGISDLRSGGPCRGATSTDGRGDYRQPHAPGVAADWLPILVWYDRADNLSHGFAYVTQDAYEVPDAQMEFHGATIEHATRADFLLFLATAPENLVPRYLADDLCCTIPGRYKTASDVPPEVVRDPRLAWRLVDRPYCSGVERIRLSEAQRTKVRALWPADHPRYWSVPGKDQRSLVERLFFSDSAPRSPPNYRDLYRYAVPDTPEVRARRSAVFPVVPVLALSRLDGTTGQDGASNAIEIGDSRSHRGMMSCDSAATKELERAVTGRATLRERFAPIGCAIDGTEVPSPPLGCLGGDSADFIAFEDDEYAITDRFLPQIVL